MGALGPLGGPFGALGASMGLPHGPQGLLKAPPEHHRPDIKPTGLEGPASAEERLVRTRQKQKILNNFSFYCSEIRFPQQIVKNIAHALHLISKMTLNVPSKKNW